VAVSVNAIQLLYILSVANKKHEDYIDVCVHEQETKPHFKYFPLCVLVFRGVALLMISMILK